MSKTTNAAQKPPLERAEEILDELEREYAADGVTYAVEIGRGGEVAIAGLLSFDGAGTRRIRQSVDTQTPTGRAALTIALRAQEEADAMFGRESSDTDYLDELLLETYA